MAPGAGPILICNSTPCVSNGCRAVKEALTDELHQSGLGDVGIITTGCVGNCALGPTVIVYPDGIFYRNVKAQDAREIVRRHLAGGEPVERLMYRRVDTQELLRTPDEIDFWKGQVRIALRNAGKVDPASIDDYISRKGYAALTKVLTQMDPACVIEEISRSGLRGRGGAGFPTGRKWDLASKAGSHPKYVICNGDEGDPGAFMDRAIMEGDPHSVLEGMAIAAYAVGAGQGYIYVRAEYPAAVRNLSQAIEKAREYKFLGRDVLKSGFDFDIEIRMGAGAFVCGEETALINSVEAKRGEPRYKPPFPASEGLWRRPTVINNVETLANVPPIILEGAGWFSDIGTERSRGTKVFALAGKVNHTGLVEVPMGTTLRTIVYDLGGGIPDGKEFKAAQTGGPSGGCIPAQFLGEPMDYDNLLRIGSMMGSGGLIIMDEDTCMVDVARFFLDFTQDESCGKCTPCRNGTKRMLEILTRITEGKGRPRDIEDLERLGELIRKTSLCGLGMSAPNPVLSTIRYFRQEYEAHIGDRECPAGVCEALLHFEILPKECRSCGLCARECPTGAITGRPREPYVINPEKCIKCAQCLKRCQFDAVVRARKRKPRVLH